MNAVELNALTKIYPGGKKAVDSIDIVLPAGVVFGFLGPNGAGKTTTVKLLNGTLSPTHGRCTVFGIDPAQEPERLHALCGVVTEHAQMYDNLSGMENLTFYGSLYGLSTAQCKDRGEALLKQLELFDAKDQKLSAYSTGMRQRLSLARALIHQPKILFLDEPTSGLDPESAQNVHAMIRQLANQQGITVFLCTHQLRYAQEICTCYGLMDQGRLLAQGNLDSLRSLAGGRITVKVNAQGVPERWRRLQQEDGRWEMPIQSQEEIPQIAQQIVENGGRLYHISAHLPSLEEIYFQLTSKKEENL
ncbi:MAG: ABC transporter ATP-binding protein [Acutalibacter sp.]|nr:ABC transporter ATP-binding protein [Acutalibacter sp.]